MIFVYWNVKSFLSWLLVRGLEKFVGFVSGKWNVYIFFLETMFQIRIGLSGQISILTLGLFSNSKRRSRVGRLDARFDSPLGRPLGCPFTFIRDRSDLRPYTRLFAGSAYRTEKKNLYMHVCTVPWHFKVHSSLYIKVWIILTYPPSDNKIYILNNTYLLKYIKKKIYFLYYKITHCLIIFWLYDI